MNRISRRRVLVAIFIRYWCGHKRPIPAITGAQLSDLIQSRHTCLTDILRHKDRLQLRLSY